MLFGNALILAAIIGIGINSCSAATLKYKFVEPALRPYVNNYLKRLNKHCKPEQYNASNYIIELDDLKSNNWFGVCRPSTHSFVVNVDRTFFIQATESDIQQLVDHELSHCLLDKDHVEDTKHYMNPIFYSIPKKNYIKQVEADMYEYCK